MSIIELSRRELLLGAAALAAPGLGAASEFDIKVIERDRVLAAGRLALAQTIPTLPDLPAPRSPGGRNDYYSEADYWWPDPANPAAAYQRRDGFSNPDKFDDHRQALIRLSLVVPRLAACWLLSGERAYADDAIRHLRAWFVTGSTRMNPDLRFAQRIIGVDQGRAIGIIDSLHLVEVARAVQILQAYQDMAEIKLWFRDYLGWLVGSRPGQEERSQRNNHGTAWLLQALQFATLVGEPAIIGQCRGLFGAKLLPDQIAADGSQPLELARTKPYGYCLFNLDLLASIAHILSQQGDPVWNDPRLASLPRALNFMFPYIEDKSRWPYPPDVEMQDFWPVRQIHLLFGGLGLHRTDFLTLWRSLDPDPTQPEIIRNTPIRQPVLWLS